MDQLTTMTELAKPFAEASRSATRFETVTARREAHINYGRSIAPIREQFKSDEEFGRHLSKHGLAVGTSAFRSDAMWLAANLESLLDLVKTCPYSNPNSVRQWLREREESKVKPRGKTTTAGESAATHKVRELVRDRVRNNEPISVRKVVQETGHSRIIVEAAIAFERGVVEGSQQPAGPPADLSLTAQQKFDRALARALAENDAHISREVHKHFNEYLLPLYKKQLEDADEIAAHYKPPFTNSEYRKIWAALHPDVCTVAWAAEVYALVGQRAFRLRGSDPESRPLAENFPTSLAELIRRREEIRQRNSDRSKAARAASPKS